MQNLFVHAPWQRIRGFKSCLHVSSCSQTLKKKTHECAGFPFPIHVILVLSSSLVIFLILMLLLFTSSFVLLLCCRGQTKITWLLWIRIYPYALILLLNFHFFLSFVRRFSCILILHLSFFLFQLNLLLIKKKKKTSFLVLPLRRIGSLKVTR